MKFPPIYLKGLEIAYPKVLELEEELGRRAMISLESLDLSEFNDKALIDKVQYLLSLHNGLKFFRNEAAIKKLKAIGLKDDALQWIVSLNDITEQLRIIESKGVIIDKVYVLQGINFHFYFNFYRQLILWQTPMIYDDNVPMTQASKMFQDLRNRQQYSIKTQGGPLIDVNTIQDQTVKQFMSPFMENIPAMLTFSKGKTESTFLKYIIEECFDYDHEKISVNKFLSVICDLFQIIMPNYGQIFKTEAEWFDGPVNGDNYDTFRAKSLKKYVLGKKPAMNF